MKRYLIPLFLLSLIFTGCTEDSPITLPPLVLPSDGEPVIYSKHIQPIFQRSCGTAGCHMDGESNGGINLDTWTKAMEGAPDYGAEIIPYSSVKSHLFQHINTDTLLGPMATPRMPLSRDPLPIEQIRVIKRWIDEGAKNDDGEVALASPNRPRLFVTAQSEDKVTAIDLATDRIMRYIEVGSSSSFKPASPHNILLSPDRNYLYVNFINGGTVEKYDARLLTKLGSTGVGRSPAQIVSTADGATLYVSNFDVTLKQRFINRIDAATMTVTDTIYDVGNAPHGLVLSPDEKTLYTMNAGAGGDDISVIDLTTREVSRHIPISPGNPTAPGKLLYEPYQGEISADGRYLWVSCQVSNDLRIVDLAQQVVVDSIKVGTTPLIMKLTPDGRQLWVPNKGDGTISIIDVASRTVVGTITLDASTLQPHAVVFSADGTRAFVSCENQKGGDLHHPVVGSSTAPGLLFIFDTATRKKLRKIEIGSFAAGMAISG